MPSGTLKRWLGDKGFGFITPDDGSGDLFAHIRQKAGAPEEPIIEGKRVNFEFELDMQRNKPKATSWCFADSSGGNSLGPSATGTGYDWQQQNAGYDWQQQQNAGYDWQSQNAGGAQPNAQMAASAGVDYQAGGENLLASLAGIADGSPSSTGLPASTQFLGQQQQQHQHVPPPVQVMPPPPPAPIKHSLEEVEIPLQLFTELYDQAGAGLEEIKKLAGGDIVVEPTASEATNGTRTLKIRGPALSVSLGACLLLQRVADAL